MRLIDADLLVKTIEKAQIEGIRVNVLSLINDAPTIETDIEVATKDAYEHGYTDGWKERFGEPDGRPKGEWEYNPEWNEYMCPFCLGGFPKEYNFCPNCGADMRGDV